MEQCPGNFNLTASEPEIWLKLILQLLLCWDWSLHDSVDHVCFPLKGYIWLLVLGSSLYFSPNLVTLYD